MASKEEKRDTIIEAGIDILGRFGLRKTTMEDIAQRSGLRKASLYYYFKSKEELVAAVIERVTADDRASLRKQVAASASAGEALLLLTRLRDLPGTHPPEFILKLGAEDVLALLPLAHDSYERMRDETTALIREILERGVATGEFAPRPMVALAESLQTMILSMFMSLVIEKRGEWDTYLEDWDQRRRQVSTVLEAVVAGLRRDAAQ